MIKEYYCILTINDPMNYGNRLQNYALQTVLSRYGNTTTIHQYNRTPTKASYTKEKLHDFLRPLLWHVNLLLKRRIPMQINREKNFYKFNKDFVPADLISETSFSGVHLRKKNFCVKKVIIGSDQVWNYTFDLSNDDLEMRLGRNYPSQKLLAYAASIGLDEIDAKEASIFKQYIPRIKHISVREHKAKELLESLCHVPAAVVLDPTLLVSASEWKKLFTGVTSKQKKYVVTYFLGKPTDKQEQIIQQYAHEHDCDIRRLNDTRDPEAFSAGPREFIEFIANSEYVFTDSYHACCFSIIFERYFKVFNRNTSTMKNMNSRMKSLFEQFGLADTMEHEDVLPHYNTVAVQQQLEERQKQSLDWLQEALRH
ncbi:Polysaccharide pyruvyl transferase [Bifidobacterium pseudolongum subsp. globosum]|uniref:Polysaccharide pyruvyl transferase n=1 Tax=Bifidobacterium pseudolongum subsp. globosum TaxID=1690 RepID=A0A4Q5BAS0_9BIFI|nr:polysaccharide pyruvyl transferase family protein [Bifidobacterium pseudolongum]RYQ03877.1 Polysaccharide pyruvyl transferase [Bifidobacterium pseudolongum subsp. globosum]RYQ08747.1 Polysaccharide pyruvyl transferase [Bifidobacterium pseudolongum subsp. globosum]RYQ12809.1 Polysaccharide pyruvyl transferase [Bifidobacterium pseudolongum subsp. globosum]RYQ15406.1 Polysaccharide pyruvyl transferase [Bifidobacterium pseudolongum subsp. globosum]RYQ67443.1 Polysaccharide pyruvyl transferase [